MQASLYLPDSTIGELSTLVGGSLEFHELMEVIVCTQPRLHDYLLQFCGKDGGLSTDDLRYVEVLTCAALVFPGALTPALAAVSMTVLPELDAMVDDAARMQGKLHAMCHPLGAPTSTHATTTQKPSYIVYANTISLLLPKYFT